MAFINMGDFGWGIKISAPKITVGSKPLAPISTAVTKVTRPIEKTLQPILKQTAVAAATPAALVEQKLGLAKISPFLAPSPMTAAVMSKPKAPAAEPEATQQAEYLDANGNPISKAEYDRQMAAMQSGPPPTIYKDERGNVITKEQYDAAMAKYSVMEPQINYVDESGQSLSPQQVRAIQLSYAYEQQAPPPSGSVIPLDELSKRVYNTLTQLKQKAMTGTLSNDEKAFITFMKDAVSGTSLGAFNEFNYNDICDDSLPSFNRQGINFGSFGEGGNMIVNTDAGTRPLQNDPIMFKHMLRGGSDMQGFGGFSAFPQRFQSMAYAGFGQDETATDDSGNWVDTLDSILSSGAKLGQAYSQYMTRNKPVVVAPAVGAPGAAPKAGIPTWIWIVGGVAVVGGAAYFFLKK